MNAKKTEVMVCTRDVRIDADISNKNKYRPKQIQTVKSIGSMISENDLRRRCETSSVRIEYATRRSETSSVRI